MKLIATKKVPMFLVELTEEEATEIEMANEDIGDDPIEISRCEGAGNKPRAWITGTADLASLVDMLETEDTREMDPNIIAAALKNDEDF